MADKLLLRSVCILLLQLLASFPVTRGQIRTSRDVNDHQHNHDDDYFMEIGNYLLNEELNIWREQQDFAENENRNVTFNELHILVETIFDRVGCQDRVTNCSKCEDDFTSDVFTALNVDVTYGLSEDLFLHACPLILYGTYNVVEVCETAGGGTDLSEDAVMSALRSAGTDGSDGTLSEDDLDAILDSIGKYYTEETYAKCFDTPSVFDDAVNDHEAGADDEETLYASQIVVAGLLQGYCIGEATLPTTEAFTDAIFNSYATGDVITEEGFEEMLTALSIGGEGDPHVHAHERSVDVQTGAGGWIREKRASVMTEDDHAHNQAVPNVTQNCFSAEELLDIYGVDHDAGITEDQFNRISPSLVQQILSGICGLVPSEPSTITDAQTWGYGTLAVALVSLLALLGGAFIPCMSEGVYEKAIQTMIALAVATLTGDAILHLIPQAVGLHSHAGEGVHKPTSPELAYVWKCLVVEMAIYVFFVFEQISFVTNCFKHSHNHETSPTTFVNGAFQTSVSERKLVDHEGGPLEAQDDVKLPFRGCNSVAVMIILGDSLHNFGDGLAIGAAFTVSVGTGLSTTIAVLCHELPHELGDVAVLLNQGMPLHVALLLNLLSACTAFIGLWIGIPIAQEEAASEWIFAVVAGMFLYVGLVDMLPMLHKHQGNSSKSAVAFLQNVGFLSGIAIILIIALYEDAINVSI